MGVPKELLVSFNNDNKEFEESNEYVIVTEGIDYENLRKLKHIDFNRTYCNDIRTIYKYFGVEAVRSALIKELNTIYGEYSVNFHHINSMLVDLMTNTGKITPIDRHGLNKLNRDPLSKASFEMPMDQLLRQLYLMIKMALEVFHHKLWLVEYYLVVLDYLKL